MINCTSYYSSEMAALASNREILTKVGEEKKLLIQNTQY
jgi:hypothetical protein